MVTHPAWVVLPSHPPMIQALFQVSRVVAFAEDGTAHTLIREEVANGHLLVLFGPCTTCRQ